MAKNKTGLKPKSINSTISLIDQNNILFKYCSEEWHPIITLNQTVIRVQKDENIFSEGEPVKGVYIIKSGKVKVVSTYKKGNERILRLASDGKILGHRGIASEKYNISAIALTETIVTFLPYNIFINLLKTNPTFSLFMIDFIAEELRQSEERIKNMIELHVKQRIALVLILLINCFGYDQTTTNKLSYTLPRKDFASLAGTTYETVIRTLIHFQEKKLIKLTGKEILIINEKALKSYSLKS